MEKWFHWSGIDFVKVPFLQPFMAVNGAYVALSPDFSTWQPYRTITLTADFSPQLQYEIWGGGLEMRLECMY